MHPQAPGALCGGENGYGGGRGVPQPCRVGLSRHRVRRQPAQERPLTAAGGTVSVDTMRAEVATRALDAGARLVNDVSGGLADPAMLPLMARADMSYVAMHWRGHAAGMQPNAVYVDVVDELRPRIEAASEAVIRPGRPIIYPGLGFAKESGHNWELLGRLGDIVALGRPVLVGASRKPCGSPVEGSHEGDGEQPAEVAQTYSVAASSNQSAR